MHKLHELKKLLCKELEEYGDKSKLDVGALDIVDKLAHAIKNIDRVIEYKEAEEGEVMSYAYRRDGVNYGGGRYNGGVYGGVSYGDWPYDGDMSYARGRGRNAKRDSMGRYSRAEDEVIEDLRGVLDNVRDGQTRQEIERIVERLERM